MSSILVAAVAGAMGGAIGGGLAWGMGKTLRREPTWLKLVPVFCVVFAASVSRAMQPSPGDRRMAEIEVVAPFQAIKTHYPADYQRLDASVRRAGSDQDAGRAADAILVDVLIRQKPKADAMSALALYQVNQAEGRALQRSDPDGCAAFMDGLPAPGLAQVQTADLKAQDRNASAQLLAQTATQPAAPSTPMTVDALTGLMLRALAPLAEDKQALVINILKSERTPKPGAESRAMCDFNLALADVILARPPAEAGALVRGIWAMK